MLHARLQLQLRSNIRENNNNFKNTIFIVIKTTYYRPPSPDAQGLGSQVSGLVPASRYVASQLAQDCTGAVGLVQVAWPAATAVPFVHQGEVNISESISLKGFVD